MRNQNKDLIWIEISKAALGNNLAVIKDIVGDDVLVSACIKGNAYGHGLLETGKVLQELGVDWFCIFNPDEAFALREAGVTKPILVMGYIPESLMHRVVADGLTPFPSTIDDAGLLNEIARAQGIILDVHLKLDSGLTRFGERPEHFDVFIKNVRACKNLRITGLGTHFATSDKEGINTYFEDQIGIFEHTLMQLSEEGFVPQIRHAANSAALMRYPESHFDMVRPGRALYGYFPQESDVMRYKEIGIELEQVITVKTRIAQIKRVPKGTAVSYGGTYITERESVLAILPIGYADGYSRFLSNTGSVLVSGERAQIRGRICMNATIIDVTDIRDAAVGDEVVVLGKQGDECITTYEMANLCMQTLPYNIITAFQETIPRFVVD